MQRSFLSLVVSVCFVTVVASAADLPDGTWKWTSEMGNQTINSVLHVESDGEKVSGVYKNDSLEEAIKNGKLENGKLSFDFDVTVNDNSINVRFVGEPSDSSINGTVAFYADGEQRGEDFPWDAKRHVGNAEVVGTWKMEFTAPDGVDHKPTVVIAEKDGKLVGKMTNEEGGLDLEELQVSDGKLSFRYSGKYQGSDLNVEQVWCPRGNRVSGTLSYEVDGNTGDFEISAVRKQLPNKLQSLLGVWKCEMTGGDGIQRTPVLTLKENGGELAASLVDGETTFDLRNVAFTDGEISFDFLNKHDGFSVEISWKTRLVDKDNMEGSVEYDANGNTGEIEVSGKREG